MLGLSKNLQRLNWLQNNSSESARQSHSHSTKDISLPVRPPIPPTALPTPWAAPLRVGPADEVTFDKPCEAFEVAFEAVCFDFSAALEAASVVEACRLAGWRETKRVCRSIKRGPMVVDMKREGFRRAHGRSIERGKDGKIRNCVRCS